MPESLQGIRALKLHELIGSSLVSIVQADAEATKATLDYIETVGFVPQDDEDGTADDTTNDTETENQGGQLRMAEFSYQKLDENDEVSTFVASVPVLSLVPIPSLQIKEAKLAFSAKITDVVRTQEQPRAAGVGTAAAPALAQRGIVNRLQPIRHEFVAKPVAASGARNQEVRGNYHIEMEISLEQADIPLGVEKIFNIMDQAIQDRRIDRE